MKRIFLSIGLLLAIGALAQTPLDSENSYEIKVTFKPFKNQTIYLGHYFGKTYPIIDSVKLNDKSEGSFKGSKKLKGGIYLVGYPNRSGFFEILVDKQQHFSIIADTATMQTGIQFVNSPDNVLFTNYQQQMGAKGKEISLVQQQLRATTNKGDSLRLKDKLVKLEKDITDYRADLIKNNPGSLLTALLMAMKEPVLTGRLKEPATKTDSLDAYNYFKSHYWDGVNFWDGRLAYTPILDDKIDKYFAQLVMLHPDSVIKEIDMMLGPASINEVMTQLLLVKFINRYLVQKYMWEDAVFVHLFEKYFAQKDYTWLNAQGRKTIVDRAYSLMANIMGTSAPDIELPDNSGQIKTLYSGTAPYTVVAFWDATCGHCREVLPKLDSFYRAKWKAAGLRIYAVSKETDGSKKDWLNAVNDLHLSDWTHVYYSKADDRARIDNNIPSYSQLYDVQTFPTLYLLDKDKRIVAKKLTYEQIDEVLQLKMKGL